MHSALFSLFLLLTAAAASVFLARFSRLPSILAYLVVGIALGPHGAGILASSDSVESVAEFGVVFLMFSIGLEFSLPRLKTMRSLVFGFGGTQMAATAVGTTLVAWFGYGQSWRSGLAVGIAVAMSSTAIVAKLLSERFALHSRSGRQTMGVLLFQDLAVVPCLILLPALADPAAHPVRALGVALLQAALVLSILIWVGQRTMRRLYDAVARQQSEELFVLFTLWVVVALAYATSATGLSLALGAFVGGMLVSETIYRHQVEADIRPFRDIFLGIFFVTVGMMLDVGFVLGSIDRLLLAVALLVVGKGAVVLLVALASRNSLDVALRTSAQLAQAGEFGLVLMQLAFDLKLVGADVFQVTLSAMLISMFLAPFLIERVARMTGQMSRGDWAHKAKVVHDIAAGGFALNEHVILCGYGRTGQQIGEFLDGEDIPFLALDVDPQQVRRAPARKGKVYFGNPDRPEVLKAAGLARARGLVITFPDVGSAERVLRLVRQSRPDMPVIVRAPDDTAVASLKKAGATEVIPEVLEASLVVAAETLTQLGVPIERTMAQVRAMRAERYPSLRAFYRESGSNRAAKSKSSR